MVRMLETGRRHCSYPGAPIQKGAATQEMPLLRTVHMCWAEMAEVASQAPHMPLLSSTWCSGTLPARIHYSY